MIRLPGRKLSCTACDLLPAVSSARFSVAMSSAVEVIINEGAGAVGHDGVEHALAEAFASCGVEARVEHARGGEDLHELARRAVSNGARAVVAGGGDGTI